MPYFRTSGSLLVQPFVFPPCIPPKEREKRREEEAKVLVHEAKRMA